ncbi:MAG TPA: DUF5666 domain-containing protein, partial [Chloroflexota bacterium]|nr:DUF5666 domain-containing protein [Chloroflexota bacterium]
MRRFTIIAVVSVIALLVVARMANIGSASRTEAAVASLDSATSNDWSISGRIQEMNGNFWLVQGFSIRVNDNTQISGVIPTVGTFAMAEGIVQPDSTWLATQIQVTDHEELTPTPTATGAVAAPNTPTPTSTATATATSTAV